MIRVNGLCLLLALCTVTNTGHAFAHDLDTRARIVDDQPSSLSGRPMVRATRREGLTGAPRTDKDFDSERGLFSDGDDDSTSDSDAAHSSQYQFKEDGTARLENTGKVYLNNAFVVVAVVLYSVVFVVTGIVLYSMWGRCLAWASDTISTLGRDRVGAKKAL
jgi:hypothetical protein